MEFVKTCGCIVEYVPKQGHEAITSAPVEEIPISYCEGHTHDNVLNS